MTKLTEGVDSSEVEGGEATVTKEKEELTSDQGGELTETQLG